MLSVAVTNSVRLSMRRGGVDCVGEPVGQRRQMLQQAAYGTPSLQIGVEPDEVAEWQAVGQRLDEQVAPLRPAVVGIEQQFVSE